MARRSTGGVGYNETRDAADDAVIRVNTAQSAINGIHIESALKQFYKYFIDTAKEARAIEEDSNEILREILNIMKEERGGGETGQFGGNPGGGGGGGLFGGLFGGGPSGGGSPASKVADNLEKLNKNLENFIPSFDTRLQKVMGFLTTNISELNESQRKIKATSGLGVGAGVGALAGLAVPIIGAGIGAGLGAIGGLIVSALAPLKEKGMKVEVTNFADFEMTPVEDVTIGTLLTTALKSAGWLVLPQILTSGFFGKNEDQSFQISNWAEGGLPDLVKIGHHQISILNEINRALGGKEVGAMKEESKSRFAIPLVTALIAPFAVAISAISGIIGLFRDKPVEPQHISALENLTNILTEMRTNLANAQEYEDTDESFNVTVIQPLIVAIQHSADRTIEVTREVVQSLGEANAHLEDIAGNGGTSGLVGPNPNYPKGPPRWPKGTGKYPGTIMSSEDWAEAMTTEFEHDADGGWIPGAPGVGEDEDEVPAKLTKGEFVVKKDAAKRHKGLLEDINNHFASGGSVGGVAHYATGGAVEVPAIVGIISSVLPSVGAAITALGGLGPAAIVAVSGLFVLTKAVDIAASAFSFIINTISNTVKGLVDFGMALVNVPMQLMGVFMEGFSKLAGGDVYGAAAAAATGLIKVFDTLSTAALNLVPIIGGYLDSAIKLLTGTITGAINAFAQFMNTLTPFVQQLSPATVEQWNLQVRNMQATIGVAFSGLVGIMTDTLQKVGGILLPIAEELAPIFNQFGEVLQAAILPVLKVFATLFQVIIPVISATFGGLNRIILEVTKSFVIIAAMIARWFGANNFIDRLIANLERPDGGGAQAVGNTSMQDFASISRDMAIAAANASAGGGSAPRSQIDLTQDLLTELRAIRGETMNQLIDRMQGMIENFRDEVIVYYNNARAALRNAWAQVGPQLLEILRIVMNEVYAWIRQTFPQTLAVAQVGAAAPGIAWTYITGGGLDLTGLGDFLPGL